METTTKKTTLSRYPAYKDSGVEWLGEIPAGWEVKRLKFVLKSPLKYGANESGFEYNPDWPRYIRITDFSEEGTLNEAKKLSLPWEIGKNYLLNDGDLLFARSGATVGKSYQFRKTMSVEENYAFAGYLIKASPNENIVLSDYLNFYSSSDSFNNWKSLIFNKATIENIGADKYSELSIPLPPLPEQRAIAAFLDEKTAKIDQTIRQKETLIALLKERKQIIIQQAVTKGLDPHAKMKASGVDWIGEIPEGWEVKRSKFVFTQRKELARKDDVQLSATQAYGVIPQEEYEEMIGRRVVKIQFHLDKRKHVEVDDFVISMRSFQGGLERAWSSGCIRSSYIVLRPLLQICPGFFGYLFKSPKYIKALQMTASFIRDGQDLNFENFSLVDLYVPPLHEQQRIAAFIETQSTKIDASIALQEKQIERLKEYKATLIDSVVTGKVKVI